MMFGRFFLRGAIASCGILLLSLAPSPLGAEKPGSPPLTIGREYNITFDDGETIRNGKILSATDTEYEIQIRGLTEKIKVERSTVVVAEPVKDQPQPTPQPQPVFRKWELSLISDLHLGLASYQSFDSFFPSLGVGITSFLTNRIPYTPVNSVHADATYTRITDGDRIIDKVNLIAVPRFSWNWLKLEWYAGAGGGIALVSLSSYSFSKFSYTMAVRVEIGCAYALNSKLRILTGLNGNYWQDNLETLLSAGLRVGFTYTL
jgi:hypothetical protein